MNKTVEISEGQILIEHRIIPVPLSISDAAQAFLRLNRPPRGELPQETDRNAWRRHIEEFNAAFLTYLEAKSVNIDAAVTHQQIAGVPCVRATPKNSSVTGRVVLFLHGGALVYLGGPAVRLWALTESQRMGCTVVAADYRMPPDHPYPAGIDDTVAVYLNLAEEFGASSIAIAGASAGAHFAAAAALKIRDLGFAGPGAIILLTPELDLTESGDTFKTNEDIDVVLVRGLPEANALYAAGENLANPYLSPIFADFATGFPPTLLQSGTRDLFLSNAVRMHRALRRHGLTAQLHVWEAMPHGGFGGDSLEDMEVGLECRCFLSTHLAPSPTWSS